MIKVPNKSRGKYRSRRNMPQILFDDVPDFLKWAKREHGLTHTRVSDDPHKYAPTQKDFNFEKVQGIIDKKKYLGKEILVSKDKFILDGHHRWLASAAQNAKMKMIVLNDDYDHVLGVMLKYPKVFKKDIHESTRQKTLDVFMESCDLWETKYETEEGEK